MEFITVRQAAENWGVTTRQVQLYLKGNRIDGALRPGHDWLIPSGAQKPGDLRKNDKAPRQSLAAELLKVISATTLPMPIDNPYAVLDAVKEERYRLQYEAEFAYLKGDFELTKQLFRKAGDDDAVKLRASSLWIVVAISTGDYELFQELELYCKRIVQAGLGFDVTAVAELALAGAYVGGFVPSIIPGWLKDGNFDALPFLLRPNALSTWTRYLHFLKRYESILDVARTALALYGPEHRITKHYVYQRLMYAAACCISERRNDAEEYLLGVMRDWLPYGFITLFAELAPLFGGLVERLLKQEYPEYYHAVIRQSERVMLNWLDFHNRYTKDNMTLILTRREYQIALQAARRVPYKKIAEQQNISLSRVQGIIEVIYDKLFVNNRDELAKYIL